MPGRTWDLLCVQEGEARTMYLVVFAKDGEAEGVGPYPASEAGPQIVDALLAHRLFSNRDAAEEAYLMAHMLNMGRGENRAGQSYPYMVKSARESTTTTR